MDKAGDPAARTLILRALQENQSLQDVAPVTLRELVRSASTQHARRGTTVYRAGEDWERLGLVVEGSVAMLAGTPGIRTLLYEHIRSGQFFGVSAVLDGKPEMAHTIILSSRASYAWIPRAVVLELCRADASLSLALAAVIARRLRTVTGLLAEQVNLSTGERLARFLLNFAQGSGMAPAAEPLPHMTQAQIAAGAGTVKEVAARIISRFESGEALRRERGHVRFLDLQKLSRLAGNVNDDIG
jgi:CRP-like cAMP-binding protein